MHHWLVCAFCYMSLYCLSMAYLESVIAQWSEHLPLVPEVRGLTPGHGEKKVLVLEHAFLSVI